MKTCTKCKEVRDLAGFSEDAKMRDGLTSRCKICMKATSKAWYKANKEKAKARGKAWREANKEKAKAWREANQETVKAWREANKDRLIANSAKRRASKLQRTPSWLTSDDFKWIDWHYRHAKVMEARWGEPYHVDHIHPLQGDTVSGLHVPSNLQVIPASENLVKNNKFTV